MLSAGYRAVLLAAAVGAPAPARAAALAAATAVPPAFATMMTPHAVGRAHHERRLPLLIKKEEGDHADHQ